VPGRGLVATNSINPGVMIATGAPSAARRWVIPVMPVPKLGGQIAVFNPGPRAVHVTFRSFDGSTPPAPADVPAGGRLQSPSGAVEVDATADVVVEHFWFNNAGPGESSTIAIPLR